MSAAPRIMFIRHAEKPSTPPPPHGVTPKGDHDDQSLTVPGWQRAGGLVTLFAPGRGALQSPLLTTPAVIYAADPTTPGDPSAPELSQRPFQTVTPLAAKLAITIDTNWSKGSETQVAQAAMAQGEVALICWQHDGAVEIANTILGNDTTAPQKWPGHRYDLVWTFDLQTDGSYAFGQVAQLLMDGDSPDLLPPG